MREWVTRSIRTRLARAIDTQIAARNEFGTKRWRSQGAFIEEAIEAKLRESVIALQTERKLRRETK